MNDMKGQTMGICPGRDNVYIDTNRILDSCRDKDCYENVPVFLTDAACELFEHGSVIRPKSANVIASIITIDSVPFNRGFYQVNARIFVRIVCETCISVGRPQEIEGVCYVDKKAILYGSEGNVNIFRSNPGVRDFCTGSDFQLAGSNLPTAVLEVVDPVILGVKTDEICRTSGQCQMLEVPQSISGLTSDKLLSGRNGFLLTVSLGFFSIIRIERPAQYLVNGAEYTVPEKECPTPTEDDPCGMFRRMAFPISDFYPPSLPGRQRDDTPGPCGCSKHT
ncbi:MAG: hypothetical protein MJ101_02385 [Clostridia bacterium]|nr:hypothetical protein [Clostridia bacterium]